MLIPYISKKMREVSGYFVLQRVILLGALLFTLGLGIFLPARSALAVSNSGNSTIPTSILTGLENRQQDVTSANVNYWGIGGAAGPWCDAAKKMFHFQSGWVSLEDQPTKNGRILLQQNDDFIKLQYNRVAGTCHRAFTKDAPAAAGINDTSNLRVTYTNILGRSARVLKTGQPLSISGLPNGQLDDMNYAASYAAKKRFVKPNSANKFTVSGLKDLPAGKHTIAIEVRYKMVNRFGNDNSLLFCVNGANQINNTSGNGCKESVTTMYIEVEIAPSYAASCDVLKINGIDVTGGKVVNLSRGQTFNATFAVRNEGAEPWLLVNPNPSVPTNLFRLGSLGDTLAWGSNRVQIGHDHPGSNNFQGAVLAGNDSTVFTANFTVANHLRGGPRDFSWGVVHDGAGEGKRGWIGAYCDTTIKLTENRPYLNISGGDVLSGAGFSVSQCVPSTRAKSADIATNGAYGNKGAGLFQVNGSTVSQYAVLASGEIGKTNEGSTSLNTFMGNYGYNRVAEYGRPSQEDVKDVLFANEIPDESEYGSFYDDPDSQTLPCVDTAAYDAVTETAGAAFVTNSDEGVRKSNTSLSISSGTVPAGKHKTLVVNGNVTITGNIQYGSYGSPQDIPYLRIIADNIYIQPGVTRVDAHLVARPRANANADGVLDTCGTGSFSNLSTSSCPSQLVVNGSIQARRILWKRTFGTIGFKADVVDATCFLANWAGADADNSNPPVLDGNINTSVVRSKKCAAELIDFSPESYIANFENSPIPSGSVPTGTSELPPIY